MPGASCAVFALMFVVALVLFLLLVVGRPPKPFYNRSSGRRPELHARRDRWEAVAETFDLRYLDNRLDNLMQVDDHKLWGEMRGNAVDVHVTHSEFSAQRMGLRGSMTWAHPLPGPTIRVTPRRLWRLWRRHLVKTGDADFDSRFAVHCVDSAYALQLMSSPVREALKTLYDVAPGLALGNSGVRWGIAGNINQNAHTLMLVRDGDDLEEVMGALDRLAVALRDAQQEVAQEASEELWERLARMDTLPPDHAGVDEVQEESWAKKRM